MTGGGAKNVSIRARTVLLDYCPRLEGLGLDLASQFGAFVRSFNFIWRDLRSDLRGSPTAAERDREAKHIPALKKPRERLSCSEIPGPWEIDDEGKANGVITGKALSASHPSTAQDPGCWATLKPQP